MKSYVVELPREKLEYCSDMLRYDNAYRTEKTQEGYRIYMTNFTPSRWKSFGVLPNAYTLTMYSKEYNEAVQRGVGFTEGVRFAQEMLNSTLIQHR